MPPEPLVLAFDTSAAHCAAALLCGDRVIEARTEAMAKGQAERLMPMLAGMMTRAGASWRDLALIGVGTGPGNFTGVRISVAAARGLALALKIPAIGVSSLEAAAFGLPRPLLVALDARRGQLYLQLFAEGAAPEPMLADEAALPAWAFEAVALTGDAAVRIADRLGGLPVHAAAGPPCAAVVRIALARSVTPQPRPAPLYLRPADAAPPRDPAPELLP